MRSTRVHISLAAFLFAIFCSSSILAEEPEEVELTKEQLNLNNEAIRALKQDPPDVDRAMKLVRAAMVLGPDNKLLRLTLGKVHQESLSCVAAEEAYGEVLRLPGVRRVPDELLLKRLSQYRAELAECYAQVEVVCERPAKTSVKAGARAAVCGEVALVDPGVVELTIEFADEVPKSETLELEAGQRARYEVKVPDGYDVGTAVAQAIGSRRTGSIRGLEASAVAAREIRDEQQATKARAKAPEKSAQTDDGSASTDTGSVASPAATSEASASVKLTKPPAVTGPTFAGSQVLIEAPVGVYSAQQIGGYADGGLSYGARLAGTIGYQWSNFVAADATLAAGFRQGNGFAVWGASSEDNQQLDERLVTGDFDGRYWVDFLGIGPSLHFRSHAVTHQGTSLATNVLAGGLNVSMSTQGIRRGNGHFAVFGRWLPAFVGNLATLDAGLELTGRFASFRVVYSFMDASGVGDSDMRRVEALTMAIGFKVPIASPLPPDAE